MLKRKIKTPREPMIEKLTVVFFIEFALRASSLEIWGADEQQSGLRMNDETVETKYLSQ